MSEHIHTSIYHLQKEVMGWNRFISLGVSTTRLMFYDARPWCRLFKFVVLYCLWPSVNLCHFAWRMLAVTDFL